MPTNKCMQGFRGGYPHVCEGIAMHVALLNYMHGNPRGLTCVHGAHYDRWIMAGNAMDIRHVENALDRELFFSRWLSICSLNYNYLLIATDNSLNLLVCMHQFP